MNIKWLFETNDGTSNFYWSFFDTSWGAFNYSGKIISDSFSGITEQRSGDDNGLISPSDVTLEIADSSLEVSDFNEKIATIRLIIDDVQEHVWTMKIKRCEMRYGAAKFWLESIINAYLEGDHPITKHPRDIWPSSDSSPSDDDETNARSDEYVVPQVFGQSYIPLRSVNTGADRHYVLGKDSYTYDISQVSSPAEWSNQSYWDDSYSYNQTTDSGYKLFQAIIADSDSDGIVDSNGLWSGGSYFYDMPTKFTSTEINATADANPADVIEAVLKDFGIPATYIDSSGTFASAATTFTSRGITWNGGFYTATTREKRLSNLLVQCAATLRVTDKIELHPRDDSSRDTILKTDIIKESFSYRPTWPKSSDGGYIEYIKDDDTPQDQPTKTLVWSNPTQTDSDDVTEPESEELNLRYIQDSQVAQKLGVLYYNRKLDKYGTASFSLMPGTSFLDLMPDSVITISNTLYGETRNVLIKSMTINKDLSIDLECTEFKNGIIDYDTLSPVAISPVTDVSTAWEQPTAIAAWIGIKINTVDFSTTNNGYAYIHGYNVHSEKVDSNGKIIHQSDELYVPKTESSDTWTISTSQEFDGYIVFDSTKSGKFTVESNPHSVVFAKKESDQWSYDNGTSWVDFSPLDTDVVIGTLSRGAASINSAGVVANGTPLGSIPNQDADNTEAFVMDSLEIQGWQFTGEFSSIDADTVGWTSGSLSFSSGEVFSISAGNTGNMTTKTFVYFSRSASETSLQTSATASNAVGYNKVLIAVAENGDNEASFYVFGGSGGLKISETNISDNSISTPKLQANSVTANEILSKTITGNEIAGNTITASEIQAGAITTVQLNFVPVETDNVVASINASSEGITIAGSKIALNGDTTVAGTFTITAASNISDVESGADVTANNTAYNTDRVNGTAASTVASNAATGATHAVTAHAPSDADKTTATVIGNAMDGTAVITTGIIRDSSSNMVIDFDDATISVNTVGGLIVDSSGGIKINEGGDINFYSGETKLGELKVGTTSFYMRAPNGNLLLRADNGDVVVMSDLRPYSYIDIDLGTSLNKWRNVYANAFYGDGSNLTGITGGYTHPTHPGDDFSVDTGALSGATVVSDIDINVTTDTLGHVTDANGIISTRTLTLADLGYTGVTNADGYYNWNLYVDGAFKKNVYSGNSVKFTGGTNVTLSYASDTITINATDTNTTYSAGTGLSLSGTTFSLATGSSPTFSTATLYSKLIHSGDTDTYMQYDPDKISFTAGGSTFLTMTEGTNDTVIINGDGLFLQGGGVNTIFFKPSDIQIFPTVDNTGEIGLSTNRWWKIKANYFYKLSGTLLDDFDDLYELSKVKALTRKIVDDQENGVLSEEIIIDEKSGAPRMDPLSLPRFITNYDEIAQQLKNDNGDLISDDEIDEMIKDHDEAGWMLSIDVGMYGDLATGAIRQLDTEVIGMFELLSSRITKLENQIKTQEGATK